MFCGKCGRPFSDSVDVCPACGWKKPVANSSKSVESERQNDEHKPEQIDDNKTVYADGQIEPPVEKKRGRAVPEKNPNSNQRGKSPKPEKAPDRVKYSDSSESARASWTKYERETAPPPAPVRKPAPKPVPQRAPQPVYPQPQYNPAPAKKKSGKAALIIAIVAAFLVLLLIGGYFASRIYYRNSDPYKISQAEQHILDGNIDKGLKDIEKVNGEQADAVRQFANLMRCREEYSSAFKSDTLQTSDDPIKAYYDKLTDAYSNFSGYSNLPQKLKQRFDLYNGRLSDMSNAIANLKITDLTNAQKCVLEFGKRKRGAGFTTEDLENVIRYSDPAVKAIDSGLMKTSGFGELKANYSAAAVKVMEEFFSNTSYQLEQDKFDLNEYLSKGKAGVTLKFNETDENYQAVVSSSLKVLTTEDDASENSNTLYTALCYAWMAYSYDIAA